MNASREHALSAATATTTVATMNPAALPACQKASAELGLTTGFGALLRRDLLLAARQRSDFVYPLFFFFMVVSLFPLALGPEPAMLARLAPGVLWIAALLSSLLATDSLFRQDFDDGSLDVLLTSPQSTWVFVQAKVLAHWLVAALPLILVAPLLALMLHLPAAPTMILLATLLLGTPVLSLISAIGAALTVGLRRGSMLVALIALPLYVPVLIFAVGAVDAAANGAAVQAPLAFLGAMLMLALTLAPLAIGAGLNISVKG